MNAVFAGAQRLRDRSRHAAPQVFDLIREKIVALELAPGTVLSRTELQASFGLSATPIRDALLRLQEEGLVDIFPQAATVVSRIDLAGARQAQFLRRAIEQEVVRTLAARPDRALLARLGGLVAEQEAFAEADDFARLAASDEAFHRTLCEAAEVPDLWDLIRRESGHIDRLRRLHLPVAGKARQIIADHRGIVAALVEGAPERAQERLRDHLSKSIALGDEIRARWPSYFA
ncbi:HTH-type transcriptional repressor RspR [Methylobacterium crusticola]|uniref:HTH-type transcriptional repressor RspR n=1 Tax=Methylobacterium crusticola TaxID=1697972 RepID=A0ABQ4QVC7_9HYPH|nr:GntR family transcriptional regulator [Methylobacterium crusticola]GJD48986.1 HTH-type transcriptional repressor RspR [Methylobacterium crusticola]